jgi:hypothetical protein
MSGEGATPPVVFDEQTRLAIENLIVSNIAARATDNTVANADAAGDGSEPIAGRDAIADHPRSEGGGSGRATTAIQPGDERNGGDSEGSDRSAESGGESEGDGIRAAADPAFSSGWYEAHRGEYIRPRFAIPERFDPHYPVNFEPETVRHYRTFCAGAASAGRKSEANALYASAAYVTTIANELGETVRRLHSLESRVPYAKNCEIAVGKCRTGSSHSPGSTNSLRRATRSCAVDRARADLRIKPCSSLFSTPRPISSESARRPFSCSRRRKSGAQC